MRVTLMYFKDCPNWLSAANNLQQALNIDQLAGTLIDFVEVTTQAQADELGFAGSPTIVVDDRDLFADQAGAPGLACRLYATGAGLAGAPTVEQIAAALARVG
ncbi:MAG: thioredoxin family protein [Candidatus Nanopelagicales bacterium]|nr:thioredoxin family protein [Candidatus Nanopelagicales bacterium]